MRALAASPSTSSLSLSEPFSELAFFQYPYEVPYFVFRLGDLLFLLSVTCACLLAVSANCFSLFPFWQLALSDSAPHTFSLLDFGPACLSVFHVHFFSPDAVRPPGTAWSFLLPGCTPQLVTSPLASKHTQSVACAPCLFELGPGRPPAFCQHIHHSPPRVPLCCFLFVLHPFVCFHLTHTADQLAPPSQRAHTHSHTRPASALHSTGLPHSPFDVFTHTHTSLRTFGRGGTSASSLTTSPTASLAQHQLIALQPADARHSTW